jgi:anti-sigma factor ChrR (cupin superfamily)
VYRSQPSSTTAQPKIVRHREALDAAHALTFRLFASPFQGQLAAPVAAATTQSQAPTVLIRLPAVLAVWALGLPTQHWRARGGR